MVDWVTLLVGLGCGVVAGLPCIVVVPWLYWRWQLRRRLGAHDCALIVRRDEAGEVQRVEVYGRDLV